MEERRERNPERFGDFVARCGHGVAADDRDERADDERRKRRRARRDVVERAEDAAVAREVDAGFLERLAHRGVREIDVAGIHPAAGARDVAAPRIALELGAPDHESSGSPSADGRSVSAMAA